MKFFPIFSIFLLTGCGQCQRVVDREGKPIQCQKG